MFSNCSKLGNCSASAPGAVLHPLGAAIRFGRKGIAATRIPASPFLQLTKKPLKTSRGLQLSQVKFTRREICPNGLRLIPQNDSDALHRNLRCPREWFSKYPTQVSATQYTPLCLLYEHAHTLFFSSQAVLSCYPPPYVLSTMLHYMHSIFHLQ